MKNMVIILDRMLEALELNDTNLLKEYIDSNIEETEKLVNNYFNKVRTLHNLKESADYGLLNDRQVYSPEHDLFLKKIYGYRAFLIKKLEFSKEYTTLITNLNKKIEEIKNVLIRRRNTDYVNIALTVIAYKIALDYLIFRKINGKVKKPDISKLNNFMSTSNIISYNNRNAYNLLYAVNNNNLGFDKFNGFFDLVVSDKATDEELISFIEEVNANIEALLTFYYKLNLNTLGNSLKLTISESDENNVEYNSNEIKNNLNKLKPGLGDKGSKKYQDELSKKDSLIDQMKTSKTYTDAAKKHAENQDMNNIKDKEFKSVIPNYKSVPYYQGQ